MNERFAIEPSACESATELQLLLNLFGPLHGRYIASYPVAWEDEIRRTIEEWPEPRRKFAKNALDRAKRSKALLRVKPLPYVPNKTWYENICQLQDSAYAVEGAIVARAHAGHFPSIDEFEPTPSSTEFIDGSPQEYLRVCRPLLQTAREVILVDPYLNPARPNYRRVLSAMLSDESFKQVESLVLFSGICAKHRLRHSTPEISDSSLECAMRSILRDSGLKRTRVTLHLVDDTAMADRMHARYILTLYGALRFDWGFEAKPGTKVDVSVVGSREAHNALFDRYSPTRTNPNTRAIAISL